MNKGQDIIACPNCGSRAVQKGKSAAIGVGLIVAFLGSFFPVIGWFAITPVGLIIALTGWIRARSAKEVKMVCKKCDYPFKVEEDVFIEYQEEIK